MIWDKYKKCADYVSSIGVIENADKCLDMYIGDQWKHCKTGGRSLPFYNVIKPIVKYKISTVCQNKMTATYTAIDNSQTDKELYELLNKEFSFIWEKGKLDVKTWEMNKQAAIQGDSYMYFGTKDPESSQILPTGTVLFGDEQCGEIQSQPYIIIRQRLRVRDIKAEAKRNGIPKEEIDAIRAIDDNSFMVGNKKNIKNEDEDGKVTSIIYLEKRDGVVHMAKAIENLEYVKLKPLAQKNAKGEVLERGLTLYPIARLPWEAMPNSARARGVVSELISNQIAINVSLANRDIATKISSYPKLIYDANVIKNPEDLDEIGAKIAVNGEATKSINQQIAYLAPVGMTGDAKSYTEDLLGNTKELSGSSDNITGAVDPTRVSAAAVTALRDQASLALNENVSNFKQLVEDIAHIIFDLKIAYSTEDLRIEKDGNTEIVPIEKLNKLRPYVRIDVTPDTASTKQSIEDWWTEMLNKKHITFEEYINGVPTGGSIPKEMAQLMLKERPQGIPEGDLNGLP